MNFPRFNLNIFFPTSLCGMVWMLTTFAYPATVTWNSATGGEWNTGANWTGGLPGSADTAVFDTALSGAVSNLVSDQNLTSITFDTNATGITIGSTTGNKLILQSGGTTQLAAGLTTNQTVTINAPIQLNPASAITAGTYTITNATSSATKILVLNGAITPGTTTSTSTLTLGGNSFTIGNNALTGVISNGGAAGGLSISKSGSGTWLLSNTANTFTGGISGVGTYVVTKVGNTGEASSIGTNGTIKLGSGATNGVLKYTGSGETTDKVFALNGTTGGATISSNGATGGLVISQNLSILTNGAKTLTLDTLIAGNAFNGLIMDSGAGATSLLITGGANGVWTLGNAANTFSGQVTIQNSQLSVAAIGNSGANSFLGANGTIKMGNGTQTGTLLYTGTGETSNKVLDLGGTTGGGSMNQSGTGLLKFTANMTATGGGIKTLSLLGSTSGTGEIAGAIVDNSGANKTSLSKSGTGSWTLSGTNTYTGTTTISTGMLQFAKEVSLYNNTGASWTAANIIVNSGATLGLNVGGAGEFTSADLNTILGIGTAGGGLKNGAIVALDTTNAAGSNFTYGTAIANTNGGANAIGITKLGTNTLTLTAANTYTGTTTIESGTLKLTGVGTIADTSAVNLTGASSVFDISGIAGTGETIGSLAGVSSASVVMGTKNLTVGGDNTTTTYAGSISGSGDMTQIGTGTTTLTGTNTSTGTYTISTGTFVVGTGTGGGWAGNIIANGGALKGRGTISGNVTINSGALYSPGNSPGIQNIGGNFTVNQGGTYLIEIDGSTPGNGAGFHDQDIVSGTATISSGGILQGYTVFSGSSGYVPDYGTKFNFLKAGAVVGKFSNYDFSGNPQGLSFMTEYTPTEMNFYAVPSDYGSSIAGMNSNQKSLGGALQSFRPSDIDQRTALNDRDKIFNGLMKMSGPDLRQAFDQLSPEKLTAMSSTVRQFGTIGNSSTANRLTQIRGGDRGVSLNGLTLQSLDGDYDYERMALDEGSIMVLKKKFTGKNGFFVSTTGGYKDVDADEKRVGYENRLGGITAGVDREFSKELTAGIFAGQGYADTKLGGGGGSVEANSGRFGIYSGYHKSGFYLNTSLSSGTTSFDTKRKIGFIGETASGSTQGYDLAGQIVGGVDFQTNGWVWGPMGKLDYGYQWIDRYNERGSAARLNIDAQQGASAETALGLRVAKPFDYRGWKWTPELKLLGAREWIKPNEISARFVAGGDPFTVRPEGEGSNTIIPGAGVQIQFSETLSFNFNYEARVNLDTCGHQIDLSLSHRF